MPRLWFLQPNPEVALHRICPGDVLRDTCSFTGPKAASAHRRSYKELHSFVAVACPAPTTPAFTTSGIAAERLWEHSFCSACRWRQGLHSRRSPPTVSHTGFNVEASIADVEGWVAAGLDPDVLTASGEQYEFDSEQEGVVKSVEAAMQYAARGALVLGFSELFMAATTPVSGADPFGISALADSCNEFMVAFFLWFGSRSFSAIYKTEGNDITHLLRGLRGLSHVFHEIAIVSVALGIVQISTASAVWPFASVYVALASVGLSFARLALHRNPDTFWRLTSLPSQLQDRAAGIVRFCFTTHQRLFDRWTQPPSALGADTDDDAHSSHSAQGLGIVREQKLLPQYEFSHRQEQAFRGLVNAIQLCCLALLLQALSETVLCAANALTGDAAGAVSNLFDLVDELLIAGLLWSASRSFDLVITTSGSDIDRVLEGLDAERGLAHTFNQIGQVSFFLALAQVVQGALPLLQRLPALEQMLVGELAAAWNSTVSLALGVLQLFA